MLVLALLLASSHCDAGFLVETDGDHVVRRYPLPAECLAVDERADLFGVDLPIGRVVIKRGVAPERFFVSQRTIGPARRAAKVLKDGPNADQTLAAAAALDPTNPWLRYYRGDYQGALALSHDYDFELLPMVALLDKEKPELADIAFQRGLAYLVRHGYEPGLAFSAIAPVLLLGRQDPLDPKTKPEAAVRQGERLYALAPLVEGASTFYAALARDLPDPAARATWAKRMRAALGTTLFGPLPEEAARAGLDVQAIVAGGMALLVFALLGLLRRVRGASGELPPLWIRLNLFARLPFAQRVGLCFVVVAIVLFARDGARGVSAIAMTAAAPIEFGLGTPGHPAALAYTRAFTVVPEGKRVHARWLLAAGDLDGADDLLRAFDDARALNDRGVIAAHRGNMKKAEELFHAALTKDPGLPEALVNTGAPPSGSSPMRYLVAAVDRRKLATLPTEEEWRVAIGAAAAATQASDPLATTVGLFALAGDEAGPPPGLYALSFGVLSLLLLGLFARGGDVRSQTGIGRAFGLVVPGAATVFSVAGPALLAFALFCWMCARALTGSNGEAADILSAIARPSFAQYYSASAPVPLTPQWITLAPWIGIAVFVGSAVVAWRFRREE